MQPFRTPATLPNFPFTWERLSAHQARADVRTWPFRTWCALPTPFRMQKACRIEMTTFAELNLSQPILKALTAEGYETPTPIQTRAIPELLAGKDLLGIAQTGTGKTAAFALPILQKLSEKPERAARGTCRALILSPTRELASQIAESFKTYGRNLRVSRAVVFGGVSIGKQIEILRGGVDVLVATPGRLVDLIERRAVTLNKVEIFVLDEVDQMLDLGFINAIRKLTAHVAARTPEPVLLGHHAEGDFWTGRHAPDQSGSCRSGPGCHHRRAGQPECHPCRSSQQGEVAD